MRKHLALLLVFSLCFSFVACTKEAGDSADGCNHAYRAATCTSPAECKKCGQLKGDPLGHNYAGDICTGIKCADCGRVQTPAAGHKFENGICSVCKKSESSLTTDPTSSIPTWHTHATTATQATTAPTAATTKPTGTTEPSEPVVTTEPTTPPTTPPTQSPYYGKSLEIYGLGTEDSYEDYTQFGKGNYVWMMRAAITEWAEMNGVTIQWAGSYNQNQILSSIIAGDRPDIIFASNAFPAGANAGLLAPFTQAEYNKLASICGTDYLDMMNYKNQSYGFIYPWTGNMMCYYNRTMFEDFGVKTPKEYFDEGNWTWETFYKCMEEITKDLDADGEFDTYGLPGDSWGNLVNPWAQDEQGRLISTIDEPWMQDYFQLKYDAYMGRVTKANKNNIQVNVVYPRFAMQLSDCEFYNFEHLYQTIPNGDELEVVPLPAYTGYGRDYAQVIKNVKFTQSFGSLCVSNDERAASVDLLAYLLKCGIRYMCDYSVGALTCEYDGILGTSELSAKWKDAFAEVCADRADDLLDIKNYDPYLIGKILNYFNDGEWFTHMEVSGVTPLTSYSEIVQMPPESSIRAIKQKYQTQLDVYNDLYIR